jgi:methyl-accepting chemotaxis protein
MRLRSIQQKIALLSGLCVVAATVALLGYNAMAAHNSRAYVGERVNALSDRMTREGLQTLASTQAGAIRTALDSAFDAARDMARGFEVLAENQAKGATPSAERREQFNGVLLNVLKNNPSFNGAYSAWEPDALDGQDEAYRNRKDAGSDQTGRFLPYWTRDAAGHIAIQPLVEYDSHELHPNGVMKGGWYIGPQGGGGESLLAPLPYIVQGKSVYLATMSVPILVDGKFRGVAGADFDLSFVQKLAERVKDSVFGGKGAVAIVSSNGLVIASSERPDLIGQAFEKVHAEWKAYLGAVQGGSEQVVTDAGTDSIIAFSPITLGRTKTPWSVIVSVPPAVAAADAAALGAALDARNRDDTLFQILVGLLVAGAGIAAMWFVARSISQPVTHMTGAMRQLANQDFSAEVPGVERSDEIGGMAAAVLVFRENGLKLQASEKEAERQQGIADRERAANEAAKAELDRQRLQVVNSIASGLDRLSKGDMTSRLQQAFPDEYEKLRADFNTTADSLRAALTSIAQATDGISSGSDQIAQSSDDLSARTERQAASLEQTSAALNTITATVKQMAGGAGQAASLVANARGEAEASGVVVEQAVRAMGNIKSSSDRVNQIIGVIDEIAFQTNLLALNAGVEAARAGDAGRGFAVVASEVRALAQRSAEAAKEIKELIRASTAEVESGVDLVDRTGHALKAIIAKVLEIDELVKRISTSAAEQATGLNEVNAAVGEMDRVVQENAAMVEESTAAANALKNESLELSSLVGRFRIEEGQTARASAPSRRAA